MKIARYSLLLCVLSAIPATASALTADQQAKAQAAVDRLNIYRQASGQPPVALDVVASDGCVAHANYLNLNPAAIAGGLTAHHEVAGNPGYTDAGKRAGESGDIAYGFLTPQDGLDGLYRTYYHRNPMINPSVILVGYGENPGSSIGATISVLQFETFGLDGDVLTPGPNSDGNATAGNVTSENPLPIPNFGPSVGNPIIAYFSGATRVTWVSSTITSNGNSAALSHSVIAPNKPSNPQFEANQICLITDNPLPAGTTINVNINYLVGSESKNLQWSFKTSANGVFDPVVASAALGNSPGLNTQPLTVSKLSIKLNFAKPGNDSVGISGLLPIPASFQLQNQIITVDVGTINKNLAFNSAGMSGSGATTFNLRLKGKNGTAAAQNALFTGKFTRGSFADSLAGFGLLSTPSGKSSVSIPIIIIFNQTTYTATVKKNYTVSAGKSGHTQ